MKYDLTYLSFGAGVQSTALLVCSNLGMHGVPRADVAIFADTGYEPAHTYQQVERMRKWSKIPVVTVHNANRVRWRERLIPSFVKNENGERGILSRKCTNDWKIVPIRREARRLLGVEKGRTVPKDKKCLALIGISLDEAHRMKPSRDKWNINGYPLVDARLLRQDCLRIVVDAGLPKPERSACYFCPFHSTQEWKLMRDRHPAEWDRAVKFDAEIRNSTKAGVRLPVFLHSSLIPLDQVLLDRPEKSMFPEEPDQFGNECEGMCGV